MISLTSDESTSNEGTKSWSRTGQLSDRMIEIDRGRTIILFDNKIEKCEYNDCGAVQIVPHGKTTVALGLPDEKMGSE